MKLESDFLYGPRKDEALNVYDLAKFEPETIILNKLFENEELSYPDKLKIQHLVRSEKLNEAAVFFTEFLENINTRRAKSAKISEESYCFIRDMIFRIFQRRLLEKAEFVLLFKMVYQFQYLRFEVNGSVRKVRDDLRTDPLFQNEDFWLHSFYTIFAAYKNKKHHNSQTVKEMLIMNFASIKELMQSQRGSLEVMKKVTSLSLGFQLEQILDEMEARPKGALVLLFYKENDVESKKQLQIFN